MGILLGLGNAQVAQVQAAHHVGKDVVHRLRRDDDWQPEILVILRHADVMEIFGNAIARKSGVQIGRSRKVASTLLVQSAVASQSASNLPYAIGPEIKADA